MLKNNSEIKSLSLPSKIEKTPIGSGLQCGTGPIPCLIVGPGSFYFNKLSDNLKQKFTFYAFDDLWAYRKGDPINIQMIESQNFDSLVAKVACIVQILKEHFHCGKVGLMGFSAPGLIAIAAGKIIGSEHIAFVIGSGIAATILDPEFKAASAYFEKYADQERKNRFQRDYETYQKLPRDLSPLTLWREAVRCIEVKQVFDYNNEIVIKQLLDDWSFTPDGKIMCEPMRQHYFTKILLQIDPTKLIADLVATEIPFLLVYGKRDYTTPPPRKQYREKWKTHFNFSFQKYEKSVHYPSSEQGSQQVFDQDVMKFLEKNNINNHFQNELTSLLSESNF